ncbi:hypothetical protein [Kitasatospora sp. GP82]|uniref:hypothetical protein n=1 Tax=Kitasatospora sp. GP82 TaxID=3035089 RepID=UPI0024734CAA|nr:hypothetical protein [Kitasatospora sp. GP82]MDH6125459.1 Zn-dependent protease with chaperone function [Kitasatospora sp. GP82]
MSGSTGTGTTVRFGLLVLLPSLVPHFIEIASMLPTPCWTGVAPILIRGFLLTVLTVVLVYLARSDVLRTREIYADRAAVGWGADPGIWADASAAPVAGPPHRWARRSSP